MTSVQIIAKTMAEDRILRKIARNTSWRENEAKARKRTEELRRGRRHG